MKHYEFWIFYSNKISYNKIIFRVIELIISRLQSHFFLFLFKNIIFKNAIKFSTIQMFT